ncbi:uncharacterized protein LOC135686923 [Rhopilema esculentum]|uniref:uncharacterized protein LOC135686923 n=1 Tax=Rhopilema esculentum TaxID=499914 RepID=UPI0031E386E9
MKTQIILTICLCLAALAVAAKGQRGLRNAAAKQGKMACFKSFFNCTKAATTKEAKKECREKLHVCKERVKELLTKIIQTKPKPAGGNRKPGQKGRNRGPKQHFCNCFRRFVNCIRKHHNKTRPASDGQKVNIHEEVFLHAEGAVDGKLASSKSEMDYKMKCGKQFKCCWTREKCGDKKGHGGKPKRKGHGKKGKRMGRGKGRQGKMTKPFPRPPNAFIQCMVAAKKCKVEAGRNKKKLKACAKNFVKCVLSQCAKKG